MDSQVVGTAIIAIPHFTKLKGLFGYPNLPTKWQVVQIARLWIDPNYQSHQANGHASNLASCALGRILKRVNQDWLNHHPPRFPNEPHHLKLVMAYADFKAGHLGTIYQAANFVEFGRTNSNRNRHGEGNRSGEKILYVYHLNQKIPVFYPIQLSLFN